MHCAQGAGLFLSRVFSSKLYLLFFPLRVSEASGIGSFSVVASFLTFNTTQENQHIDEATSCFIICHFILSEVDILIKTCKRVLKGYVLVREKVRDKQLSFRQGILLHC